jgi:Domain of unknown function (DUF4333)
MAPMRIVRVGLGVALAATLAFGLAACGEKTVDADSAAASVTDVVAEQTGFEPDDVSCPDDVEAEVGVTFECDFTGPDGDYLAEVEIVEVSGDEAQFRVVTKLDR